MRFGQFRASRRRVLTGIAAGLSLPVLSRIKTASASGWRVYANTTWDDYVELWDDEPIATLVPGTTVELLDGPTADGWYLVDPIELADVRAGWVPGWLLSFGQRARAVDSLTLLGAPDDWSFEIGPVRHGFTVSMIGPVIGDWVLVRSGDRIGYAPVWSLVPAEGPESDRTAEYWVDVNRSSAEVQLVVGDSVVDLFSASISEDPGEGFYATAVGTYWVYEKVEELSYTPYADAYFMYWAGFDPDRYNGFHSWTMDAEGNLLGGGGGATAGCVATSPDVAWTIFHFVDLGTRVEVHW